MKQNIPILSGNFASKTYAPPPVWYFTDPTSVRPWPGHIRGIKMLTPQKS